MSETNFTPGPWECVPIVEPPSDLAMVGADGVAIGTILEADGTRSVCFDIPDAYLIAAAPDLYAALHAAADSLRESLDADPGRGRVWRSVQEARLKNALDALAKARGES